MAAGDISDLDPRLSTLTEPAPPPPGFGGNEEEDGAGAAMTLIEHLEELRHRLIISLLAVAACSVVGFVFWDPILHFLLLPLPAAANRLSPGAQMLVATGIGEPFMIALKLAVAVGLAVASPVVMYQLWSFVAPALTRKERKYALPFTLLGAVLFAVGLVVGFVVLRYPVDWLVTFGNDRFTMLIDANNYFTFVAYFLLAFAIVFELPLVVTFLGVVGIVNSRLLRSKRLYILFGLWVLSCFITPGADPYSPIIIAASFTILFEISVILLRVIGK